MRGHRRTIPLALTLGLLAAFLQPAPPAAAGDFHRVDYVVRIDGSEVGAEVWQSRVAGEMLILSDELPSPVRLVLREARAETVQFMKVDRQADGGLNLLPNATERALGTFTVAPGGEGVEFRMDGRTVELRQKPPLLGERDLAEMKAYSRDYVRLADEYEPSAPFIERLRAERRAVRVEVYFGSWCPFCQQMVPRMMRVAEELEGSNIEVDFYGLPQGEAFARDPKARNLAIVNVPTGIVYVDGRENGRISANGWKIPELTLNKLLTASRQR